MSGKDGSLGTASPETGVAVATPMEWLHSFHGRKLHCKHRERFLLLRNDRHLDPDGCAASDS
jgi:hypothetical protein